MKKIDLGLLCPAVVLSAGAEGIYKNGWIDRNKNGEMDPYKNPALAVDERVADLRDRMTIEEETPSGIPVDFTNEGSQSFTFFEPFVSLR